ncbi:MAG: hypothetical protein P4L46_15815 [Fimbriimonas sp.]|nr:hypothetical protein [Fimbriimonas sp.]
MLQRPFHPILFALFPVLSLYSLNTALVPIRDVPGPMAVVLGCTCLFWLVLGLVLRDARRGATGASVGVVTVFSFGHLWDVIRHNESLSKIIFFRSDLTPYWAALLVVLVVAGCWKWKRMPAITQGMNIAGIVLAGFPAASIGMSFINAWRGTMIAPLSSSHVKLKITDRPDIYYVILDGFGRTDALKRVIGFDDGWFVRGLEDRGFYVASDARANYCQTELSLSSSLNLNYIPEILPRISKSWDDRKILDKLIDENEVSRYLKKLGYRYEAITTGFPSVNPNSADLWLNTTGSVTYFAGVLFLEMPVSLDDDLAGLSQFVARRKMIDNAMSDMPRGISSGLPPRFVFTHILAPHPPFVFGPNGEPRRPQKMGFSFVDGSDFFDFGGTVDQYKQGYSEQAAYIGKQILATIDKILKASPKPPIIIVQGDHGSKLRLNQQLLEKTDVNECFPNLNAYFVPPKVKQELYPGITPVNSFRIIFDGLFGDSLPKLEDRSYYSGWLTPFDFTDVSKRVRSPGAAMN